MPTILQIDVATAGIANRIVDNFAAARGYTGFDNNSAPETKQQFLKRMILFEIKETVKSAEANAAANTARLAAEALVESQVTLT